MQKTTKFDAAEVVESNVDTYIHCNPILKVSMKLMTINIKQNFTHIHVITGFMRLNIQKSQKKHKIQYYSSHRILDYNVIHTCKKFTI